MEMEPEIVIALICLFIALLTICSALVETLKKEIINAQSIDLTLVKQNFKHKE